MKKQNPTPIKTVGKIHIASVNTGHYALTYSDQINNQMDMLCFIHSSGNYEVNRTVVNGMNIIPYGPDNNLPANIRKLLEKNNLAPGIIARKTGLIYGQGLHLYETIFENNEISKQWCQDKEIQSWLDSWNAGNFVRQATLEFNYLQGFFCKYYTKRGNASQIAKIELVPSTDCRFERPSDDCRRLSQIKNIIVYDYENGGQSFASKYPILDISSKRYPAVSMAYHCQNSFGHYFYSMPSFIGSVPWINRANDIPEIIKALTDNMIAAAYVVHVPNNYFEEKRAQLLQMQRQWTDEKINNELIKFREDLTRKIADVLAGKKNSGKFIEVIDTIDLDGNKCEFKIEPIEMNIDKFITAQAEISRIADSSTTSGLGLNPSLSNIIIDGKSDSGSQMLYALKLFYASDTQISEDIILEPINRAIRLNFPQKNIKAGFYRQIVNKEDNVSLGNRSTNQI